MIEKFYALLERFVIALELIATNFSAERTVGQVVKDAVKDATDTPTKSARTRKAPAKKEEPEDDEPEDDEPEEKPTTKKRGGKTEAPAKTTRGKKGTDKRAAIGEMAKAAVEGDGLDDDDADALVDKFDDLLEDFEVKNVKELDDDQVDEFHDALKELIEEFYDAE
jgi:hypothetical protein